LVNKDLKKQAAERVWLEYFNRVLFEKGVISETERNKMTLRIEARKA